MSKVELIPINKGNRITLNPTSITTIGRSPQIGCLDNKISRNHVQLYLKSDGTIWIKSIHHNPTFYKTKTNQIVSLTQNKEYQLNHNDQFGLLPDEYFYRVSIITDDNKKENHSEENSSTTPKSPMKVSETIHTLPAEISDHSLSTDDKDHNQSKTNINVSMEEPMHISTEKIVADKNDVQPATVLPTAEQSSTSNSTNEINNQPSTSTVIQPNRERCPYGASCYRKNPIHRQQAIHPGDSDWESDDDDDTKPVCPYGNKCYRTNPDHLNEYDHSKTHQIFDYDEEEEEDHVSTDCSINDQEAEDDDEWKPDKDPRYLAETDDESSNESDKELTKKEAEEFIRGSTTDRNGRIIKKPRVDNDS